jgi:hypothetical protein
LIVGPSPLGDGIRSGDRVRDDHAAEVPAMIIGFGFLALFFVLSTLLGTEDPRRDVDPRDELPLWARFGGR